MHDAALLKRVVVAPRHPSGGPGRRGRARGVVDVRGDEGMSPGDSAASAG